MDHEGIARLAALAKLDISDTDRARFARQLTTILAYVDQVQSVDTRHVQEADLHRVDDTVLREDVPSPSLGRDAALAGAPDADRQAGLFRVPQVIG